MPDVVLLDPLVSQQWIESKGNFAAGLDVVTDALGRHNTTMLALHINSTGFWVLVVVYNLVEDNERHALVFNFDEQNATLPLVQSTLDRVSPRSLGAPKIQYNYVPVSESIIRLSSHLLTMRSRSLNSRPSMQGNPDTGLPGTFVNGSGGRMGVQHQGRHGVTF